MNNQIFTKTINGKKVKRINIDGVNYSVGVKKSDLTNESKVLYCLDCEGEYSANIHDYFWMQESDTFNCECGSENLILE